MIGKARKYKWLDFTDAVQCASQTSNWYSVVLQDIKMDLPLRTTVLDRANYHWGYSSNTLWWERLFQFTAIAIGENKAKRDIIWRKIISTLCPEPNPWSNTRWFYDLTWKTDWWEDRVVSAKVYQVPFPTNWLTDPLINFTFDLYCETEKVYSPTTKTASWWLGLLWWFTLPTPLPISFFWYSWYIEVNNLWDWSAPCKIEVLGNCNNLQIMNITNWMIYRNNWRTTDFIIDNTNLDNDPTKISVVTDLWVNIKANRNSGADIFLDPWMNRIVVLSDNYTTAVVTITRRDCYIF